jgi:hypothetical protein
MVQQCEPEAPEVAKPPASKKVESPYIILRPASIFFFFLTFSAICDGLQNFKNVSTDQREREREIERDRVKKT